MGPISPHHRPATKRGALVESALMSPPPTPPAAGPAPCLTDSEIARLQAAAPGRAPEALARHLASCERCQARALFGAERRAAAKPGRAVPAIPSLGRSLALLGLVVAAMAAFFYTLAKLTGRLP
jgi:hypothetical protein